MGLGAALMSPFAIVFIIIAMILISVGSNKISSQNPSYVSGIMNIGIGLALGYYAYTMLRA